jgi:hypothetical protein
LPHGSNIPLNDVDWFDIADVPDDGRPVIFWVPDENLRSGRSANAVSGRCTRNTSGQLTMIVGGLFSFDYGEPTHWTHSLRGPE